jgi:hypothetical protein
MKRFIVLLLACFFLQAQQPVKNVDGNGNELILAAGGRSVDSGMTLITTGGVTLFSSTTKVQVIHCKTNGTAATLTITDGGGSPITYFDAISFTANQVMIASYGTVGLSYASGVKISASANSALQCRVVGVQ